MDIEELAFKDRKTLAQLNGIDLLNIIEFLQKDRQQWINQFSKTHNESVDIQRENQELKEKVNKLEILIETLKLGVTLNQEQEDLLDKVLFGGDSNE